MTRVKKRLEIIINRAASARNFRLPPLLLDGDQRSRESYAFVQNRISDRLISGNKLFLLDVRNIPIHILLAQKYASLAIHERILDSIREGFVKKIGRRGIPNIERLSRYEEYLWMEARGKEDVKSAARL